MRVRAAAWAVPLAMIAAAALTVVPADARPERLQWTHPDASDVTSFRLHWGASSRTYTTVVDVGVPPASGGVYSWTVEVPDGAPVYFAVTAFDARTGQSSVFSNERLRAPDDFDPDPPDPDPDPDPDPGPDPDPDPDPGPDPGPDPDPGPGPDPDPHDPPGPDENPDPVGPGDRPPSSGGALPGFATTPPPPLPEDLDPPTTPPSVPLGVPGQPQLVSE